MSDRIVVMHQGRADQVGTPFEIYNAPKTRFVATFVGTLNQIDAVVADPGQGTVTVAGATVNLGRTLPARAGDAITLALRPETLHMGAAAGRDVHLPARITEVHFLGSVIRVRADIGGSYSCRSIPSTGPQPRRLPWARRWTLSAAASDFILLEDAIRPKVAS